MKGSTLSSSRKIWISCMKALMYLCSGLTGALVLFLMGYVLIKGIPNISWELLSTSPSYLSDRIGILPDLREQITCFLPVTVGIIHPQIFLGIQSFFLSVKQFAPDIFPPFQHGLEQLCRSTDRYDPKDPFGQNLRSAKGG